MGRRRHRTAGRYTFVGAGLATLLMSTGALPYANADTGPTQTVTVAAPVDGAGGERDGSGPAGRDPSEACAAHNTEGRCGVRPATLAGTVSAGRADGCGWARAQPVPYDAPDGPDDGDGPEPSDDDPAGDSRPAPREGEEPAVPE
ncbi:hypothetical protein ACFYM0_02810 [Streptomyces sp. NPDC006487]|uniref:hypothetical protein n=1 Tax=Streptomyces sp. NPDC006487 TaxID=3364748 RepID=UPI003683C16F